MKVLVADDNQEALFALKALLEGRGYEVLSAYRGDDAWKLAEAESPDLFILDIQMPGLSGYELTEKIKNHDSLRFVPVVLLSALDSFEDVTIGLKKGADDYLRKPFNSQELLARLQAILRTREIYRELSSSKALNTYFDQKLSEKIFENGNLIGSSSSLKFVLELIEKIKDAKAPVLILGESGTGKELLARALHERGERAKQPYLVQNCALFRGELLASELFGHFKGSFTGAIKDKKGLFELADRGTLFLDEIGEMDLTVQAMVLRVLQEGTFMPVGGGAQKQVDVRIVAATNRNLKEMVEQGKFREDLYYRINVLSVNVPALRERREDIGELVNYFLKLSCQRNKNVHKTIAPSVLRKLQAHNWPGNIRELQNEIERLVLLSGNEVEISEKWLSINASDGEVASVAVPANSGSSLKDALAAVEKEMITTALKRYHGNRSEVARELGISRSNLIAKIKEYELT